MALQHNFNDGNALFQIGLEPLAQCDWLEVDHLLDDYLDEKNELYRSRDEEVFIEEFASRSAQSEVLEMVRSHLASYHSATHAFEDGGISVNGAPVFLDDDEAPLKTASKLVQEDLLLLQRDDEKWRLTAGSLCFPSTWSLHEKFGKPLDEIHDSVPEFGPGSRTAHTMARIFDNLKVEHPVRRANWSLHESAELFHPGPAFAQDQIAQNEADPVLRIEHQTLRKLPASGAILFTVRILVRTFDALANEPATLKRLATSLAQLNADQLAYKNLGTRRAKILQRLAQMAGAAADGNLA